MHSNSTPRRFATHLPLLAAFAMNPWFIGFFLICAAGLATLFSVHYALSLLLLVYPFVSYYLERNLLDRVLLPPFSILTFWAAISSGFGVALIIYARNGEFDSSLMKVQVASLIAMPIGWCFYRVGFGRIPNMHFPEQRGAFERDVVRPLVWVGWFFLLFTVFRTIVMLQSGNLDRGESSGSAMGQGHFGYWTYFNAFPRFNNMCFFLVPLMWRSTPGFGRILMLGLLGIYFLIVLVSGARGILIYPMIFIAVGLYFFRALHAVKLDLIGVASLVVLLPLIVFIDAFRNTDAYRATSTGDIAGRLAAFDDALERLSWQQSQTGGREGFSTLGKALLGRSDAIIYQLADEGVPHAWFNNFDAIPYTFVPSFMMRNKPILIDSNIIYWNYLGEMDGTGRGMSVEADAYRRFGWLGVPVVIAFYFWLYGFICGRFYKHYFQKDALFGILLILLTFSFFQSQPFSSVLETWWHMSYNMVKHLLALYFGYWALKKILNIRGKAGLHQYIGGNR
jgi:hypothetical protein